MDRLIYRQADLVRLLGISKMTLTRWVEAGNFPRPVRLSQSGRTIGWKAEDVTDWISSRPAA